MTASGRQSFLNEFAKNFQLRVWELKLLEFCSRLLLYGNGYATKAAYENR
jgi:hypothetical protein